VLAYLFELYADEFLVLPAMHYRWSFPASVAKARADFAAVNGDPVAAGKFASRMGGSIGFLGVAPDSIPGIEAHTRELLDALSAHFAAHPFLLGGRPSLADCAVMGPFYAHLYQDAVPSQLLRETAPAVCHWMQRCNCPDPDAAGEWASPAALQATLRPLLALIGGDAVPILVDTVRAVEEWAATRPPGTDEPPRMVGGHATRCAARSSIATPARTRCGWCSARSMRTAPSRRPSGRRSTPTWPAPAARRCWHSSRRSVSVNAASPSS
jgi:glutathione S-transferase